MGEEEENMDYGGGEESRVTEWEVGLPSVDDLMPLSQPLISPELASAFSISPVPRKTELEVNRASQNTLSTLRRQNLSNFVSGNLKSLPSFGEDCNQNEVLMEESDEVWTESRKGRKLDTTEEVDSELHGTDNSNDDHDPSTRALKRSRLVWTSQLHKRFIDVVEHLGITKAVPKTIMQLMNVEGLTRENVASHLQKYRLYLKRMQGLSNEGPSSSDQLFGSAPVPQSFQESAGPMPVPMPYGAHMMPMPMPMPVLGMAHGHGHVGMPMNNPAVGYHGFGSHPYNMFKEQQRDWSGNNFGSHPYNMSFPHVTASDK
ncbi:transcription factor PCL1-like [Tasmannia lanceolata]|uniref:transcription factor PCL1-like n=1 Tax=Tasmannia lanceolata TaxID=3420 RepID=UPI0040629153